MRLENENEFEKNFRNIAKVLLGHKEAIERNNEPVTATFYVNPVDAHTLIGVGLKEFKDFIVSPYAEQGYVYDSVNFCMIDINNFLSPLQCVENKIQSIEIRYDYEPPRMNREQRRKAERENRKNGSYKTRKK